MNKITNKILSSIFGNATEQASLAITSEELFGDKNKRVMDFIFYNGFAFCPNFEGKSYYFEYPLLNYFTSHPNEAKDVMNAADLKDEKEITPYAISLLYGEVKEFGEAEDDDAISFLERDIPKKDENNLEEKKDDKVVDNIPSTTVGNQLNTTVENNVESSTENITNSKDTLPF